MSKDSLTTRISLRDWKIDYTKHLGSGAFGDVYELVERPDNEKGLWFSTLPDYYYYFDKLFPVIKTPDSKPATLCIKIYKPMIVLVDQIKSYEVIPLMYYQRQQEQEANPLLRQAGLTRVVFYNSPDHYTQVKTLVPGMLTFKKVVFNNFLLDAEQILLRQNLVTFFQRLGQSKLWISDLNSNNLMFHINEKEWDIIDGNIHESDHSRSTVCIAFELLFSAQASKDIMTLVFLLVYLAEQQIPYSSPEADELVRNSLNALPTEQLIKKLKQLDIWAPEPKISELIQTPEMIELKTKLKKLPNVTPAIKIAPHSSFFHDPLSSAVQTKEYSNMSLDMLWGMGLCISGGILVHLLDRYSNEKPTPAFAIGGFLLVFCLYALNNNLKSMSLQFTPPTLSNS